MSTANDLPKALKGSRCIVHIDLDCFYCQVEEVRLGLPRDKPAAVQQWQGLIAVNYAARRAGITRHCNVQEAKEKCPEINLVHVATFAENDPEPRYYPNPSRATHKVSLDAYRQASKKIFKIFAKYCSTVQKIGLDEAFMDITNAVNEEIANRYLNNPDIGDKLEEPTCNVPIDWDSLGVTIESEEEKERKSNNSQSSDETRWSPTTWQDLQLAVGAEIAKRIRQEIYDELQYTCSAGIGHNKVIAKLCSSFNKPNNQTILRNVATLTFMRDIPFRRIRNLGGKLGSEVEDELGIQKSSDIWQYSLESLQKKFGDSTGLWIYNIARGIDGEEVIVTKAPKSLMASKSMRPPVQSAKDMQRWATILSNELHMRLSLNFDDFGTWPRTLCMHLRSTHDTAYRSKSCNMLSRGELRSPDKLTQKVFELLSEIGDPYPCVGLSLQATGMMEDESAKTHDISKFFAPKQPSYRDREQQQQPSPPTSKPAAQAACSKIGLLAFYSKTTDANQDAADLWTCPKCLKKFPFLEKDEHNDYHFALELQQEERNGLSFANSSSPAKRKTGKPLPDSKKPKKNLFFQPRS